MNRSTLTFLRRVLWVDAAASAAMGVVLALFAVPLAPLLSLPEAVLREAGVVLIPFAALVAYLASRQAPSRIGVWIVISVNALWVLDSIAVLFTGWISPNAFGYAFIIGQAAVVALFAELEYIGLRKEQRLATQAA